MVTTLGDALEMVSKVFMAKMGSEQSGKSFESELKGLKAAMDAVEFPPSTKNQKKCPRRKQGPGRP
jgi:hypothetical protein